jgi:fido (protein-threonine AMPylation protein)
MSMALRSERPPQDGFFKNSDARTLRFSDLVWINARLRNFEGELGLRSGTVETKDESRPFFHPEDLQKTLGRCLRVFNEGLRTANELQDLVHALAYFWATFLFRIHPFADGNGRTTKFLTLWLLQGHQVTIPNFQLLNAYQRTDSIEDDIDNLEQIFSLSIRDEEISE